MTSIHDFLYCPTPTAWLVAACDNLPLVLIDHANCEKKAASTALGLIYKYIDRPELLQALSKLAREELRHFEQVHSLLLKWQIDYVPVTASRYAQGLRSLVANHEPQRLIDILLVGAVIEARSCERFDALSKFLKTVAPEQTGPQQNSQELLLKELADFYQRLLASEARHFAGYLKLARAYNDNEADLQQSLDALLRKDQELVTTVDTELRFHSGVPG